MIKFSRIVDSLPESTPFVGPETQQRQRQTQFVARLGANENVFGPSPEVLKEVEKATSDIWMYADPENFDLKEAIATHHGLNIENIVVGEGIDGLLGYLCRLFVEPGVNVVTSKGAYPTFNYHVLGFGGELKVVPYKNDFEDIEGLVCEAKRCEGSIIYLANPDNPMGTFHSGSVIEDMVSNLPAGTLLCLDEAYSEFAIKGDLPKIDPNNTQVVRFRTFSKAYGLAGARVGYAIGPSKIIKAFDKIRNHFGVNIIAQRAAKVALEDQKYLLSVTNSVAHAKREIEKIVKNCGLEVIPSATNFVAVDCGRGRDFAFKVLDELIKQDIFVRMPSVEPLNRCIRISVGKQKELTLLRNILPEVVKRCSN